MASNGVGVGEQCVPRVPWNLSLCSSEQQFGHEKHFLISIRPIQSRLNDYSTLIRSRSPSDLVGAQPPKHRTKDERIVVRAKDSGDLKEVPLRCTTTLHTLSLNCAPDGHICSSG